MPKNNTDPKLQQAINAIVLQAQAAGIRKFMLATRTDDNHVTVHFQELEVNDQMNLLIAGLHQALISEANRTGDQGPDYARILQKARDGINGVILELNTSMIAFRKNNPPKRK